MRVVALFLSRQVNALDVGFAALLFTGSLATVLGNISTVFAFVIAKIAQGYGWV
ncbi:hypothetical protein PN498_26840 [Oscillatoria sp. CS-180]|uniref:hypothetical protein n=1 Tax=Oscillatoria sp. CS-180 TaxID=3021720 RepID=UPI00232C199C|nr:hypothetical protein [Oscillatoria sp. CS-180]MDB9529636.1 hypothetical protein [Oscillatoria sp. CS-180]